MFRDYKEEKMFERIKGFLCEYNGLDPDSILPESKFEIDLGLTSYDVVEMCAQLEEEVGVEIQEEALAKIETVNDLVEYICRRKGEANDQNISSKQKLGNN